MMGGSLSSSSGLSRGSTDFVMRVTFIAEPAPKIQTQQILGTSPRMTREGVVEITAAMPSPCPHQHSTTLTARPPSEVSLYFSLMSLPV